MHFEIWWAFAFVLAVVGIQAMTKITTSIIERAKSAPPRGLQEISGKVERINQAVEAMAIEVERIGESQRFLTKVLSEKEPARIEKGSP
jgi:hypothetical protein